LHSSVASAPLSGYSWTFETLKFWHESEVAQVMIRPWLWSRSVGSPASYQQGSEAQEVSPYWLELMLPLMFSQVKSFMVTAEVTGPVTAEPVT